MDLVKQFLDAKGATAISALADAGFNNEQANRFIPEAIRDLVGASQTQDLPGLLNADRSQQVSQLLGAVDVSGMAARLGIDTGMAGAGIAAVIPQFLGLIKDQGLADLVSMLGKGGMGGVASLAKGLFH